MPQTARQQHVSIAIAPAVVVTRCVVSRMLGALGATFRKRLTRGVLLGAAVAEEIAVLGVGDVVAAMADPGAHGADTDAVDHVAGVTVVPVLVHELLLGDGEGAELVAERVLVRVLGAALLLVVRDLVDPLAVGDVVGRLGALPGRTGRAVLGRDTLRADGADDVGDVVENAAAGLDVGGALVEIGRLFVQQLLLAVEGQLVGVIALEVSKG